MFLPIINLSQGLIKIIIIYSLKFIFFVPCCLLYVKCIDITKQRPCGVFIYFPMPDGEYELEIQFLYPQIISI